MSRVPGHESQDAADAAVDWLLRLDGPQAAEADWLALEAWLQADPLHRQAFADAERVWADVRAAAPEIRRALAAPALARRRPLSRSPSWRRAWIAAAGAAAAAAAVLTVSVVNRQAAPAPAEVFQTAKGQSRVLTLVDGSRIHLNSASRIAVRMEPKGRHVELTEGEAAFDVAHDAARPFLVDAGARDIRVVGTEFDVLRHRDQLRVTVRRGVVAVQSPNDGVAATPVMLTAGDQFDHRTAVRVSLVRKVDPETVFAWRRGELIYRDQPLDEIVEDLNRYLPTALRVEGAAANLRFSGVIRLEAEDAVLRRLQAFLPITATRDGTGVALRRKDARS